MLWLPSAGDVGTEDGSLGAVGTDSISPAEAPDADSLLTADGRKKNEVPEGDEAFLQDLTDFYLSVFPRSVFDNNIKLWLP